MNQSSSPKSASLTGTKKRIKVHKRPSITSSNESATDEEERDNYLPPAARDSKWVGLSYYNPNFENQIGDEVTDEGEIRLIGADEEEEEPPIYNLFPKLREKFPQKKKLSITDESTTEITKSLVGQTPNFAHMKKCSKFNPMKLSLPSLKEIPNEDEVDEQQIQSSNETSDINNKSNVNTSKPSSVKKASERRTQATVSHTSTTREHYDEDDSDSMTNLTARKKRRTKKRTDIPKNLESGSSYSGINQSLNTQKENGLKPRRLSSKEQKTIKQHSSQASLADEESV